MLLFPLHYFGAFSGQSVQRTIQKPGERIRSLLAQPHRGAFLLPREGVNKPRTSVLLAAAGLRVSEALAVEGRHFTNEGRTITVEQQIQKDAPQVVKYLKTAAAKREVDLHPEIAEYLQRYAAGKSGLLFHTANGTPHLYGNLEDRWLTPRLTKLGADEKGMGFHAFRRFRNTWLRGTRCLEDLNNFWMAHKPHTYSACS